MSYGMSIGNGYGMYDSYGVNGYYDSSQAKGNIGGLQQDENADGTGTAKDIWGNETDDGKVNANGRKSTPEECQTCKNRKYQDGSNEMVSFKAAGHINPDNAAAMVMSHEQEHVSNAYQKADANNGEVVRASVQLKTAVCPECGRTYISGGETNTQIRYYNEDNPYQKDMKESDAVNKYRGANVDVAA